MRDWNKVVVNKHRMKIIKEALREDKVEKDITSFIVPSVSSEAYIIFKENGVLCGVEIARKVFNEVDKSLKVKILKKDGTLIKKGEKVIKVYGKVRSILKAERVALNFLQHLSGIATITRKIVLNAGKVKVFDTRKTIPGLRKLQKYAVKTGGGINYRNNLEDAVMIKDNHWVFWKGEEEKFYRLKRTVWRNKKIIIEVDNFGKLKKTIKLNPDVIMLDNMNLGEIKRAVRFIRKVSKNIKIEVSGGVDFKKLSYLKKLKINRISIGSITHSVKAVDISLKFYE